MADKTNLEYEESLVRELRKAKIAWDNARNFFDQVTDKDLVDYAIFEMEAAERKYMYLLKLLKEVENQLKLEYRETLAKLQDCGSGGEQYE